MSSNSSEKVASIFKSYYSELRRFVTARFGFKADADDIIQDAFQSILGIDDLESIDNPRAYLFRSASNIALNHLRRQGYHHDYLDTLNPDEPQGHPMEQQIIAHFEVEAVQSVLSKISEKDRKTFLLNRVDGKTYLEIAHELDITVSAVEKRIMKVLMAVRKGLDR